MELTPPSAIRPPRPDRAGEHDVEAAGLAALDDRVDQVALLAGDVGVGAGRRLEAVPGLGGLVVGLGHDGVDPVVEQAVAGSAGAGTSRRRR